MNKRVSYNRDDTKKISKQTDPLLLYVQQVLVLLESEQVSSLDIPVSLKTTKQIKRKHMLPSKLWGLASAAPLLSFSFLYGVVGWCAGPGQTSSVRARAYCTCSRFGWGLFGHFYYLSFLSSFSLSLGETVRYRLKYYLKGPFNPKQATNQSLSLSICFAYSVVLF